MDREVIHGGKWVSYRECCLSEVGIGRGYRSCSEVKTEKWDNEQSFSWPSTLRKISVGAFKRAIHYPGSPF